MPELSATFRNWLDTFFFRRTPEGLVFIGSPPWMFGPRREYKVSDAQAERLVALIRRAYVTQAIVFLVAIGVVTVLMPWFVDHPIAMVTAAFMVVALVSAVVRGMLYRLAGPLLAGISWTEAPREPYSFVGNLKKLHKGIGFIVLPTPILILLVVVALIGLPMTVIDAYKALASGRVTWDISLVLIGLYVLVAAGAALVQRLNKRSAK
jgi:hypothetical protein